MRRKGYLVNINYSHLKRYALKTIYQFSLVLLFFSISLQLKAQEAQQITLTLSANGNIDIQVAATQDKNFTINWGDGQTVVVTGKGSDYIEFNHFYSTATTLNITITGNTTDCDLTSLSYYGYNLSQIDLSLATKLEFLNCPGGQLTTLDVSKNTSLTTLYCGGNELTTLDLSKNVALQSLDCSGNKLTTLDVSMNTKLYLMFCMNNNLTDLKVSPSTLRNLHTNNNNFSLQTLYDLTLAYGLNGGALYFGTQHTGTTYEIPVAGIIDFNQYLLSTGTNTFSVRLNGIQARQDTDFVLDSGKLTFLSKGKYVVSITNNLIANNYYDLPELSISVMVEPTPDTFTLNYNVSYGIPNPFDRQISVAATPNTSLTIDWGDSTTNTYTTPENGLEVQCTKSYSGTGSYKVKITSTGEITKLYCCGLNTTSMDLSKCPSLKNIYCSGNLFTSIDLSACPALEEFNCPYSLLTSLDVSKNTSLKSLDCMFSKLTSIDLSKNSNLQYVYFEGNAIPLDKLDSISKQTKNTIYKYLGTQTLPNVTVAGNAEIDLTNQAMLENHATTFIVQKDGKMAIENIDYTLENGKLIFLSDGAYTVTMTNDAIISTSPAKVVASYNVIRTGTNELSAKTLKVYPNPTHGVVHVESESETLASIKILGVNGQLLLQKQANSIDLSSFENGIYLMQVDGKTVKIIKH